MASMTTIRPSRIAVAKPGPVPRAYDPSPLGTSCFVPAWLRLVLLMHENGRGAKRKIGK